jgi:hypothetical protein
MKFDSFPTITMLKQTRFSASAGKSSAAKARRKAGVAIAVDPSKTKSRGYTARLKLFSKDLNPKTKSKGDTEQRSLEHRIPLNWCNDGEWQPDEPAGLSIRPIQLLAGEGAKVGTEGSCH